MDVISKKEEDAKNPKTKNGIMLQSKKRLNQEWSLMLVLKNV